MKKRKRLKNSVAQKVGYIDKVIDLKMNPIIERTKESDSSENEEIVYKKEERKEETT